MDQYFSIIFMFTAFAFVSHQGFTEAVRIVELDELLLENGEKIMHARNMESVLNDAFSILEDIEGDRRSMRYYLHLLKLLAKTEDPMELREENKRMEKIMQDPDAFRYSTYQVEDARMKREILDAFRQAVLQHSYQQQDGIESDYAGTRQRIYV